MEKMLDHSIVIDLNCQELQRVSELLTGLVSQFYVGEKKIDIGAIKSSHLGLRIKIAQLLDGKNETDVLQLRDIKNCDFGDWCKHDGKKYMDTPEVQLANAVHEELHRMLQDIIRLEQEEKHADARSLVPKFDQAKDAFFERLDDIFRS